MSILYVMAAEAEYGPHLRARIQPLLTGIGPVEAAIALTAALTRAEAAGTLPTLIVSLGSAGSNRLEQCGLYQASSVSYRDMDASALGFPKSVTPYLDQPAVVPLHPMLPGLAQASLSTGGNVVSGAAYTMIDADMVDMETFAILRVCQIFGLPLIALRGISDGADPVTHVDHWRRYLHIIDEKLAIAVDQLEAAVKAGQL